VRRAGWRFVLIDALAYAGVLNTTNALPSRSRRARARKSTTAVML
jgi:hypothetical protein